MGMVALSCQHVGDALLDCLEGYFNSLWGGQLEERLHQPQSMVHDPSGITAVPMAAQNFRRSAGERPSISWFPQ